MNDNMHIINTSNFNEFVKLVRAQKERLIAVQAKDDEFNRKALEYGRFDVLLSPEAGDRKIKLRQADSGLNHVTAKIASKNRIAIGVNLEEISILSKQDKASRFVKIRQNIAICRKAKARLAVITKDKKSAYLLLLSLGASTQQASQTLYF